MMSQNSKSMLADINTLIYQGDRQSIYIFRHIFCDYGNQCIFLKTRREDEISLAILPPRNSCGF